MNATAGTPHDHGRGFQDGATSALDEHKLKMCTLLFRMHFLIDLNGAAHGRRKTPLERKCTLETQTSSLDEPAETTFPLHAPLKRQNPGQRR